MSNRHRTGELVLPPPEERRVQARSERHRVNVALAEVTEQLYAGTEPDDVVEPGVGWKIDIPRDPSRARTANKRRRRRHWKLKMWKRRTAYRRAKAVIEREIAS